MEIEIFTLCDFAQDNNQKLTVVGTFDVLRSKEFPCTHPFCSVACRIRFSNEEAGEHNFKLRLINKHSKEIIAPIEGVITISPSTVADYAAVNLVINLAALKFEGAGRYSFELYIDDEWRSGLGLYLVEA